MGEHIQPQSGTSASHVNRLESRLRVRLPVKVTTRDGQRCCVLEDLSANGARVSGNACFRIGQQVVLQWGRFEAFGEVRWGDSGACGLTFYAPVPMRDLLTTRHLDDQERLAPGLQFARRPAAAAVAGLARA